MTLLLRQRARKLGFTLIELMVVLVLMGILTAMIIPEMRGTYDDALLRSAARKLVNVFNLANSRAITLNQLHRVRLDPRSGRYSVERSLSERERESAVAPAPDIAGGNGTIDTRITAELRKQGEVPSEPPDAGASSGGGEDRQRQGGEEVIAFYPDGTAEAGELLLRDQAGFRLALRINPTTARVRIIELERE